MGDDPQPGTSSGRPQRNRKLNSQYYGDDFVSEISENQKRSDQATSVQTASGKFII